MASKQLRGAISISRPQGYDGDGHISISIEDSEASVEFLRCRVPLADFARALTGLSSVPMTFDVSGLENVGKTQEIKTIEFEIPDSEYKDRAKVAAKIGEELCRSEGLGFICDSYFGSQRSFFSKDGKKFARCFARRWV